MEEHKDGVKYECNICFDLANEPVVTQCGHLYCWSCIYAWLASNRQTFTCPVCNSGISADSLIPVFIRESTERPENMPQRPENLPQRPAAQRQDPVRNQRYNPFRMFDMQVAPAQEETVTMSAGFGFFPPLALLLTTFNFTNGESAHAPLDTVTRREVTAATLITILLIVFFGILF